MKKEKLLKRGLASLLAVVLAVGLLPMMPGNMATVKAADGDKTVSLGTDVIKNPTAPTASTDTWKGSYVYFGTYGGNPVKYRVLDKNTTVFGGTTMLLDCDSILWAGSNPSSAFDDNSNDWANSNIRTYLNGTFLTNNFSAVEQSAIASSTKSTAYSGTDGADGDGCDGTLSYASLSNDKIFFLDAKEATNTSYGYSNEDGSAANREKTGGNAYWWLRSADTYATHYAGFVDSDGYIHYDFVGSGRVGVSPALNINLSSVLFTSVISGTKGETGAEYKLTLLDNDMTIAGNGNVSRSGGTVTVPYTISGTNSGSATQVSVLILGKEYTAGNTNGATVLAYEKLAVDSFSVTGTGTFTLPAELLDKTCGTDYYAYIIAEDVNGEKETDYASEPVSITVPAKPWEAPTVNAINIGTPGIIDPAVPTSTSDAWKGCYVYFGTYGTDDSGNPKPVKYRVLDSETSVFGGTTMLLDCDSILWAGTNSDGQSSAFDGDSNVWADSDIKTYLNGTFLTNNFSTAEQSAIASSNKSVADGTDGDGYIYLSYASLNNDKIFFLDAKEATNTSYGYSNTYGIAANRKKTGGNAYWWLRSAVTYNPNYAGIVISDGNFGPSSVDLDDVGVSPAFNINLSSVLFSSVSGTSKSSALTAASSQIGETTGTEWKLTLADTGKTVQVIEDKKVIKAADGTITVPYTYTDAATAEAEKVNQISVMITDKAYAAEGAKILYYGALQNIKDANGSDSTVSNAATGTGTFELPDGLTGTLGEDYHVYILAEHVNENSNATDYASTPVEITAMYNTIEIETVEASINTPKGGQALSTDITCTTDGVESATLSWTDTVNRPVDAIANYYPWTYKAHITVTPKPGYVFTSDTQITVNGTVLEDEKTVNADGTITVTGAFGSSRDKLISITAPQSIHVANGTDYASMNLPTEVNIVTEEGAATTAAVSWDTTTPASGSYDQTVLTEQTVTLNGTVTCPEEIDTNGVALTTTITITIEAAGITGAPTANPVAGTYTENQSVALTSSTEGATIYYTTDGSEPTLTEGVPGGTTQQYTAPIAVTGTEGESITTAIKAIAVKSGMQDSSVETFTYTIQIPVSKYTVTVTSGSGSGQYAQGETVTITASAAPSGQQFKAWEIVSGNITLASSTSETTSFTMPAEEVSVKAIYEAVPVTEYTITATAGANGTISPNGAVRVTAGGSQTFTISPSSGYVIDSLKVDGLEVTAATSYTFSDINANHTIEAAFKVPASKYTVTVTNGSGSGQYAQGETVTITASAAPSGQQFKEWEIVSGNITLASSTSETTSFTMPAEEVSVKAIYEAVPVTEYTITATAGANGTISPNGAVRVTAGGSQTFTISPSSGYVIDTLTVDGLEVTAATSYTFSDVNANHTIEATFKQESQTPVVTVPSITTQPGNATVKVGETATFTIAATGTDLTYQWQIDRNDGNGWVNIAGATATSYTTSTVDISCNGFKYQCVVSNLAGTVTSNTAVLTVTENSTPDPDPIDYNILDGANSSWTQNSDGSLSIRGSGAFSKFVGVKVDGSLVDAKNYTVKEGSTIVTLKADYLNTLSVGTHTFEILWTDGSASTTFTIKADTSDDGDKKDDVPKTGDNTPVAWLFILSILSGTGLIITAKKRRVNPDSSKR